MKPKSGWQRVEVAEIAVYGRSELQGCWAGRGGEDERSGGDQEEGARARRGFLFDQLRASQSFSLALVCSPALYFTACAAFMLPAMTVVCLGCEEKGELVPSTFLRASTDISTYAGPWKSTCSVCTELGLTSTFCGQ